MPNQPTETATYVHEPLDREVTAIAGHYVLTAEVRLPHRGREVLYVVGHAVIDTSCCGMGGCGYAIVPGYVLEWHAMRDERDRPVTRVEPVRDPDDRRGLERAIRERESLPQVQFLGPASA